MFEDKATNWSPDGKKDSSDPVGGRQQDNDSLQTREAASYATATMLQHQHSASKVQAKLHRL